MSDPTALPAYAEEFLAELEPAALIDLMVSDEDRVPRNVIDACAGRGEEMVVQLRRVLDDGRPWKDRGSPGEWWLAVHACMILGLVPGEQTGLLLVAYMRRIEQEKDDDLQDWLAGWWPALFRNKPDSVLPALREICGDRSLNWYSRAYAFDPVIAAAERESTPALDEALAWAAGIAADETEDWKFRLSVGNTLLDFAPAPYRPLLEDLADKQPDRGARFSRNDIEKAYSAIMPEPEWHRWSIPGSSIGRGPSLGGRIGGRRKIRKMRKRRERMGKRRRCPTSERRPKLAAMILALVGAETSTRSAAW